MTTASGYVGPTATAGSNQVPTLTSNTSTGTASCSSSAGTDDCYKAFDSDASDTAWRSNSLSTSYVQYQFTSAKTIASYTIKVTDSFDLGRAPKTWTFKGSNDGSGFTTLDTQTNVAAWSATEERSYSIASPGSYTYYRLEVTATHNAALEVAIRRLQMLSAGTTNNMTLITTAQTADSSVTSGRVLLEYNPVDAITLNTDFTAEVTCNGGTNWASATLSAVTSYSGGSTQRSVAETADTSCTSGTSFAARIKTLNNKNVQIFGASLTVH